MKRERLSPMPAFLANWNPGLREKGFRFFSALLRVVENIGRRGGVRARADSFGQMVPCEYAAKSDHWQINRPANFGQCFQVVSLARAVMID